MSHVLLIDDDDGFRKMLKTALEMEGYSVLEAVDGVEGTEILEREEILLIITDIFMPKKEGINTILDIKTSHPDTKIIAISGGGYGFRQPKGDNLLELIDTNRGVSDILELAKDFGADAVLSKPVKIKEFIRIVNETVYTDGEFLGF